MVFTPVNDRLHRLFRYLRRRSRRSRVLASLFAQPPPPAPAYRFRRYILNNAVIILLYRRRRRRHHPSRQKCSEENVLLRSSRIRAYVRRVSLGHITYILRYALCTARVCREHYLCYYANVHGTYPHE